MNALGRKYIWHPSRTDEFKLVYFSDIHWFAKACAEKHVLAQRDAIRDEPNTFWIGGGDYAEFIGYQDAKRFDPDAVSERVRVKDLARLGKASYEAIRELFEPIKGKCLGLIEGNHEREYARRNQQSDLHGWLCTELGVSNMGYSSLFDLVFQHTRGTKDGIQLASRSLPKANHAGSETFRIFCHHGAGYAQTKGGKINRLSAFMLSFDADLYFMGHIHDELGLRM